MRLYRPAGLAELRLIAESGFQAFPPRLAPQPIFYPVLDRDYAEQIARDWNSKDEASGFVGFVTRFEVDDDFVVRYPPRTVGGSEHQELRVPAKELEEFNRHIVGPIEIERTYAGSQFEGLVDPETNLPEGLSAIRQTFEVWRQDDNGVEALVRAGLTQVDAQALADQLEATGHKQIYWVRASDV